MGGSEALRFAAVVCIVLAGSTPARAIEEATIEIARSDGGQWQAEGISIRVSLDPDEHIAIEASVDRLSLPAPVGTIRDIELSCRVLSLGPGEYRCARTRTRANHPYLEAKAFEASVRYDAGTGALEVRSSQLPLAVGSIVVEALWQPAGWSLRVRSGAIDAGRAWAQVQQLFPSVSGAEIAQGNLRLDATARSREGREPEFDIDVALTGISAANEAGTVATETLSGRLAFGVSPMTDEDGGTVLAYRLAVAADAGEAYFEPVYFNLANTPLEVQSEGHFDRGSGLLAVTRLDYAQREAANLQLSGRFRPATMTTEQATIVLTGARLPIAYKSYLQGFLVGTPLARLQTSGRMQGRFEVSDDRLQRAQIRFADLDADDTDQRLAMYGARGELNWSREVAPAGARPSHIEWNGGFVYAIGYGQGRLALALGGDDIRLLEPLRVALLSGALVIDTFDARGLQGATPEIDLNARLEPVGLRRLTAALGWPAFPGTLAGELPMLSLRDGVVTLGGSLVARVFDGTATVSGLRIEEPFSANRRAFADVRLDNLDLALLTDVFSLGRIEGRLDGRIEGLQTVKDTPVGFDARFYTPPEAPGRRRISRRAVSNISEIGGGGAALTSGFLRFFETFGYASIGIRCRLVGDVCEMSGVKPAEQGYYLIEGRGLPRIDVIGHSREVNWPRLVAQIEKALGSGTVATGTPSGNTP